ncbi:hypothetical protein EYF80_001556 [Liparis tanakae]|uniref:Uncharacterized protein n=1 Tax=Liparis tanakae TaxID=230148 RepID=A0A4Z2JDU7_9TELE|nr:hypothetical protein EYF80_001556 [Liparis tanakae]
MARWKTEGNGEGEYDEEEEEEEEEDSSRCPHAGDGAKRKPPAENLTQHGVMAATTPDKH